MNIYIWPRLDYMTSYYHCEAGVVCVAKSLDAAKKQIEEASKAARPDSEDSRLTAGAIPAPKYAYITTPNEKAAIHIFPDAGCC